MVTALLELDMIEFTAQDRCDRCGAQAKAKATKAGLSELLFCTHHYRENRDKLLEQYWLIETDESPSEPVPVSVYTE